MSKIISKSSLKKIDCYCSVVKVSIVLLLLLLIDEIIFDYKKNNSITNNKIIANLILTKFYNSF